MKLKTFSTFDVVKILKINRNTLQAAISGGFINPGIHKAEGKSDRTKFSLEGVYSACLYFHLLRSGVSRKVASKKAYEFSWNSVLADNNKYLVRTYSALEHPNLLGLESLVLLKKLPTQLEERDIFYTAFNLLSIKSYVDNAVSAI